MTASGGTACRSCKFWHPTQARDPADPTRVLMVTDAAQATIGQCRRFAPTPGSPVVLGDWPKTNAGDWCGEWVKST